MQSPAIFGFASNSPDATRPPHPRRPFRSNQNGEPARWSQDRLGVGRDLVGLDEQRPGATAV